MTVKFYVYRTTTGIAILNPLTRCGLFKSFRTSTPIHIRYDRLGLPEVDGASTRDRLLAAIELSKPSGYTTKPDDFRSFRVVVRPRLAPLPKKGVK